MTGELLGHAADYFNSREVTVRFHDDDRGRYAFSCMVPGADGYKTPMVVTAKKYLVTRNDLGTDGVRVASFMKRKVLERASDMDGKAVQFVGQSDRYVVFDPDAALAHGVEPDQRSTRRDREDWLDVPERWSVTLDAFADRQATPQTDVNPNWAATTDTATATDGGPRQGQTGLGDYADD